MRVRDNGVGRENKAVYCSEVLVLHKPPSSALGFLLGKIGGTRALSSVVSYGLHTLKDPLTDGRLSNLGRGFEGPI